MAMKQLDHIMQKEMTRKEFLGTLGFGLASILGFSGIVKYIFNRGQSQPEKVGLGYGASRYGR